MIIEFSIQSGPIKSSLAFALPLPIIEL